MQVAEGEAPGSLAPEPPKAAMVESPLSRLLHWMGPYGPPLGAPSPTKKLRRVPLVAGAFAGCAATLAALVLRFMGAGLFVPELGVQWFIESVPGAVEAGAVTTFGGYAKILGLTASVIAFVAAHAAFALYYGRLEAALNSRKKLVGALAAGPLLVTGLVVFPLFGVGPFGASSVNGWSAGLLATVASSIVFAIVVDSSVREYRVTYPEGFDVRRRTLILTTISAALFGAAAFAGLSAVVTTATRRLYGTYSQLLANEVTPNESFYVVSKNLSDPAVNPSDWQLVVNGLVATPLQLTSDALMARPQVQEYATLMCVSNPVGGGLISNAMWSGVRLRDLIDEAGPQPSATWVAFACADGYTVAVPLFRARQDTALLALLMNGERLSFKHGFPARMVVPGIYGMFQAKWVKEITLVDHEVMGYWQLKGWTNEGTIHTNAIIAVVPQAARAGSAAEVGGTAFAGTRPITRVEVSDDGGGTWQQATLKAPLSPQAWTLWRLDWTPQRAGTVRLLARAWSQETAAETPQTADRSGSFPDGSTGYDAVDISVAP